MSLFTSMFVGITFVFKSSKYYFVCFVFQNYIEILLYFNCSFFFSFILFISLRFYIHLLDVYRNIQIWITICICEITIFVSHLNQSYQLENSDTKLNTCLHTCMDGSVGLVTIFTSSETDISSHGGRNVCPLDRRKESYYNDKINVDS